MANRKFTPDGTKLELVLIDLKGKEYLQVAQRIHWFRTVKPDWTIETDAIQILDKRAVFKATIKDQNGRVISQATKSEDFGDFKDFIEKAETGAIGRALALCGYGTQFTADELDEGERLADAPIAKKRDYVFDQPTEQDGVLEDKVYRVPFGKFVKRKLDEIDLRELENYIVYLENQAEKKKQPIQGAVKEFIDKATMHINSLNDFNNFKEGDIKL